MENYRCRSVGIVGSGIQGVCTGLQLIKKGIPVTIFDRHDPLSTEFKAASYGNAGHFSPTQFCNSIVQMFYMMFLKC